MEEQNNPPQGTDMYVALDRDNRILAMEKSQQGDDGFRLFLDEFAQYAANRAEIPAVSFFDLRYTDASRLPYIDAGGIIYYLDPSIAKEGLSIPHNMSLKDVLYCCKYGLDPLADSSCVKLLSTKSDYQQFRNEDIPIAPRLQTQTYRAVETEKGIALFTPDQQGQQAYEHYLQYHADYFYNPDFGVDTLRIYDVEANTGQFWDKVNPRYILSDSLKIAWVPEHPFVDKSILRKGYCLKQYDMRAYAENFWNFADHDRGEKLYVSNNIRDLTGLEIIIRKGYDHFLQNAQKYWNEEFVFKEHFDNIERKYAGDSSEKGQKAKSKEQLLLAAHIFFFKFHKHRSSASELPQMQAEGINSYRDFEKINLLMRPDKLLETYERRCDEPIRNSKHNIKP